MTISEANSEKPIITNLLSLLCCSLITLGTLSSCSKKEEPVVKEVVRPAIIMTIEQEPTVKTIMVPGKVRALDRVELSFEVSGKLISLPAREGQHIEKGDTIARIDPSDYQSRLDASQARVDQTRAELRRYDNLLKEKVVAKSTYDVMKRNYEVSLADMEITRKAFNDTILTASYSGMIGKRFVENFQVIQAKQPIVSLQKTSAVEIVVDVPENMMRKQKKGSSRTFDAEFANYPGEKFDVSVKEYATEADLQTQTYRIVFKVNQLKGKTILDGMTATVYAHFKQSINTSVEIPVQAVFYDENGQAFIWKTNSDMRLVRQKITVGMVTNGNIIVLSGLANGDSLVTSGVQKLKDGMKVRKFTGTVGE